ncbi:hypothetical protein AVEN_126513-1, partial [Araneus ventricosus]
MTINKSQGQTFDHVGIYLDKPVFSHGHLYVALSRLEKELDAQKEDDRSTRKNEIQRGPIVVITNSSSCEDVHSEPDDVDKSTDAMIQYHDSDNFQISQDDKNIEYTKATEKTASAEKENITNSVKPSNVNASPSVPMRTKMVNGFKGTAEKTPAKK